MSTHSSSPQPAVDLDKEAGAGNRPLSGVYLQLATVLAIAISAYAIYANALSNTQEFYRNTTFLSGILITGFILFPFSARYATRSFNRWDYLFIILTLVSYGYFYVNYLDLHVVRKSIPNATDYVMAAIVSACCSKPRGSPPAISSPARRASPFSMRCSGNTSWASSATGASR